jgi:hypothetical protein
VPDPIKIVEKAMQLRGAAPETWNEFVLAIREYAAGVTTDVLKHPPDTLLRAQGMALGINELATILHTAPQLHDKMGTATWPMKRNHGS